jgi:hypothetical protein
MGIRSCEALREEADMGDADPCGSAEEVCLGVLSDCALHHPASYLEALGGIGAFDYLDDPATELGKLSSQLVAGIAAIGKDMAWRETSRPLRKRPTYYQAGESVYPIILRGAGYRRHY